MAAETERSIQEELSLPIILADRIIKCTSIVGSFESGNSDVAVRVFHISQVLRSAARLTTANPAVYDFPLRRVLVNVTKTLERALAVVQRCGYNKVLRHVLSITSATDFKKVLSLLESSFADIQWVLSILDSDSGTTIFSLPPIAGNDPNLSLIWPQIAALQMGRAEAAEVLAILTMANESYRKIVAEEKGIPPLLKMVKESKNPDAQKASICALYNLANDPCRARLIANAQGVKIVANAFREAPITVKAELVKLVSRMSQTDGFVQEEFGKENVTKSLVSLLGMDVRLGDSKATDLNENMDKISDKEKEEDLQGLKPSVKMNSATALCILARRSLLNSRNITETKALLVLSKLLEKEKGELQLSSLLLVMELSLVAETNSDLKRSSFKPNSPAAKAVIDQLLKLINNETNSSLLIPAIKAIGCLSKMFSAKETRIIESLVTQLGNVNLKVSTESALSLSKFVCEDNYNRIENSKVIIDFDGVKKVMNLIRIIIHGELHLPGLLLLCNLAINIGNSKALEQVRALTVLESCARHVVAQNPNLKPLFSKALHQLTLYQHGFHIGSRT